MRETSEDNAQALLLALGVHVLLFGLMFAGLLLPRSPPPMLDSGSPINATLVDADMLSEAMQRTLVQQRHKPPAVEREPMPQPAGEETAPMPQPVSQEAQESRQTEAQNFIPEHVARRQKAVADQPIPTLADQANVRKSDSRQGQVDPNWDAEAQPQQRLTRLEAERLAQLGNIRRQRAGVLGEAGAAEQRLNRIADAGAPTASRATTPIDANHTDTELRARYAAALQDAILAKWTRPDAVPIGARCRLIIHQLPGGEVMSAEVSSPCAYDKQGRRSLEAAVRMAWPLPYTGFETVFARTSTLNFEARDR